mmetsp:Transcript_56062/g.121226  ORF Transcript_56062/g.121226 Transcript_56062/m.121226 type:complete len:249 (-) Transcript_56062:435-1181(-)
MTSSTEPLAAGMLSRPTSTPAKLFTRSFADDWHWGAPLGGPRRSAAEAGRPASIPGRPASVSGRCVLETAPASFAAPCDMLRVAKPAASNSRHCRSRPPPGCSRAFRPLLARARCLKTCGATRRQSLGFVSVLSSAFFTTGSSVQRSHLARLLGALMSRARAEEAADARCASLWSSRMRPPGRPQSTAPLLQEVIRPTSAGRSPTAWLSSATDPLTSLRTGAGVASRGSGTGQTSPMADEALVGSQGG